MYVSNITIISALFGGIGSVFSPCILPILPVYFAYIMGISQYCRRFRNDTYLPVKLAAIFLLGFGIVFLINNVTVWKLSLFLLSQSKFLVQIGGAAIVFFGLASSGIAEMDTFFDVRRNHFSELVAWFLGAFFSGAFVASAWTPCVGPTFANIYSLTSDTETVYVGIYYLLTYVLGMCLPFIISSAAIMPLLNRIHKSNINGQILQLSAGKLLTIIGMTIFLGNFGAISEAMGEITIVSASIFITFFTVAVTQIWMLWQVAQWFADNKQSALPWSVRLLFFVDLLSVAMLQVIRTFEEYTIIE